MRPMTQVSAMGEPASTWYSSPPYRELMIFLILNDYEIDSYISSYPCYVSYHCQSSPVRRFAKVKVKVKAKHSNIIHYQSITPEYTPQDR